MYNPDTHLRALRGAVQEDVCALDRVGGGLEGEAVVCEGSPTYDAQFCLGIVTDPFGDVASEIARAEVARRSGEP